MVRLAASTDTEQILAMGPSAQIDESRRVLVSTSVDRGECFVAEENGVLLGYGIMNYGFFDRGFVPLIYIDTAHRRSHIGTRLFDEFENRCRTSRIFTSTNLSNLPMQAFLACRGYVLSGVVQHLDENDPEFSALECLNILADCVTYFALG